MVFGKFRRTHRRVGRIDLFVGDSLTGLGIHDDRQGGDIRAARQGVGAVRIAIRGAVIGPAQGCAVHPAKHIDTGSIVSHGMVGQADVQAVLEQRFLENRNVLYHGSGAAIAGCNTSCRIHLIGTGNILERIGFYLQRNESHGIPLKQKSGRLPVLVLDQPLCLVVFVNPVKVQRGRVGDGHVAGNVSDQNGMLSAGLVKVISGGMNLLKQLCIVVVVADDGLTGRRDFCFVGKRFNQLVHAVDSTIKQRAIQIDFIKIAFSLLGKVPVPIHKTGEHGFPAQVNDLIDIGNTEKALALCVRLGAGKDDFAVQGGDDVNSSGIVALSRFGCGFRNGIDFTIVIDRIGNFVRSIQLHAAAEEHRYSRRD